MLQNVLWPTSLDMGELSELGRYFQIHDVFQSQ